MLCPGGRFVFSTWDRIEANAFAQAVTMALAGLFPDDPPMFLARTPHGCHEPLVIGQQLREAGFVQLDRQRITAQSHAESARIVAFAFCQGTPLRNELEARAPGALDQITDAVAAEIGRQFGPGPVSGQIQPHVFTASR